MKSTVLLTLDAAARNSCKVDLFQHGDFSGWKAQFGIGSFNLDQLRRAGATNDELSALTVYGEGCEVKVFQHDHFQGWSVHFGQGVYDHGAFTAKGAWNDHVSSIIVSSKYR
jgi:hypothetical protein